MTTWLRTVTYSILSYPIATEHPKLREENPMPKSNAPRPRIRPVITLKPERYQPTKAVLEEDVSIPTTPERLAKVVGRKVIVRREKK